MSGLKEVEVVTYYERGKKPRIIMVDGMDIEEYEVKRKLSQRLTETQKPSKTTSRTLGVKETKADESN